MNSGKQGIIRPFPAHGTLIGQGTRFAGFARMIMEKYTVSGEHLWEDAVMQFLLKAEAEGQERAEQTEMIQVTLNLLRVYLNQEQRRAQNICNHRMYLEHLRQNIEINLSLIHSRDRNVAEQIRNLYSMAVQAEPMAQERGIELLEQMERDYVRRGLTVEGAGRAAGNGGAITGSGRLWNDRKPVREDRPEAQARIVPCSVQKPFEQMLAVVIEHNRITNGAELFRQAVKQQQTEFYMAMMRDYVAARTESLLVMRFGRRLSAPEKQVVERHFSQMEPSQLIAEIRRNDSWSYEETAALIYRRLWDESVNRVPENRHGSEASDMTRALMDQQRPGTSVLPPEAANQRELNETVPGLKPVNRWESGEEVLNQDSAERRESSETGLNLARVNQSESGEAVLNQDSAGQREQRETETVLSPWGFDEAVLNLEQVNSQGMTISVLQEIGQRVRNLETTVLRTVPELILQLPEAIGAALLEKIRIQPGLAGRFGNLNDEAVSVEEQRDDIPYVLSTIWQRGSLEYRRQILSSVSEVLSDVAEQPDKIRITEDKERELLRHTTEQLREVTGYADRCGYLFESIQKQITLELLLSDVTNKGTLVPSDLPESDHDELSVTESESNRKHLSAKGPAPDRLLILWKAIEAVDRERLSLFSSDGLLSPGKTKTHPELADTWFHIAEHIWQQELPDLIWQLPEPICQTMATAVTGITDGQSDERGADGIARAELITRWQTVSQQERITVLNQISEHFKEHILQFRSITETGTIHNTTWEARQNTESPIFESYGEHSQEFKNWNQVLSQTETWMNEREKVWQNDLPALIMKLPQSVHENVLKVIAERVSEHTGTMDFLTIWQTGSQETKRAVFTQVLDTVNQQYAQDTKLLTDSVLFSDQPPLILKLLSGDDKSETKVPAAAMVPYVQHSGAPGPGAHRGEGSSGEESGHESMTMLHTIITKEPNEIFTNLINHINKQNPGIRLSVSYRDRLGKHVINNIQDLKTAITHREQRTTLDRQRNELLKRIQTKEPLQNTAQVKHRNQLQTQESEAAIPEIQLVHTKPAQAQSVHPAQQPGRANQEAAEQNRHEMAVLETRITNQEYRLSQEKQQLEELKEQLQKHSDEVRQAAEKQSAFLGKNRQSGKLARTTMEQLKTELRLERIRHGLD